MNSFRQYLEEGRDAPLYHATRFDNILSILRDGLKPHQSHSRYNLLLSPPIKRNQKHSTRGVSFTRNFNIAKKFGSYYAGKYIIFKLDQRKLAQRFKILPIDFWSQRSTYKKIGNDEKRYFEAEEYIITEKNISTSYMTEIFLKRETYSNDIEKMIFEYAPHLKVNLV